MEQQLNYIPQGSEQWLRLRSGKLTSSMAYVFMGAKGIRNGTSERFINKKLMELVTGEPTPETKASQLAHGHEWEDYVKQYIANKYQSEYFQAEFLQHPDLCYFGGSSDGFINIAGIDTTPEIKCPVWEEAMINRRYLINPAICKKEWPEIYWQCMGNMILQNSRQALAISFHHKLPEPFTSTELIIPYNEADAKLLLDNLAAAYEWLKDEAEAYGIDMPARYLEFAKPLPSVKDIITDEQAFNHDQAA